MQRYMLKSKGAFVEAVQLGFDNVKEVAEWCGGHIIDEEDKTRNRMLSGINISTPIGVRRLSHGMYLVKYQGQFYTAQRGVFESQYIRMTPEEPKPDPRDQKKMGRFLREPWFDKDE